jgi:hypothetical protein
VVTRQLRTNRFPATCTRCGQEVAPGAGVLMRSRTARKNVVRHKDKQWIGTPCAGEAIGQPGMGRFVGGCPTPEQQTTPAEATA